jgi:hypothetical protein
MVFASATILVAAKMVSLADYKRRSQSCAPPVLYSGFDMVMKCTGCVAVLITSADSIPVGTNPSFV